MDWKRCVPGALCEPEPRRVTAAGSQQWAGNASWVARRCGNGRRAQQDRGAICANAAHCEGGGTSNIMPAPSTSSARLVQRAAHRRRRPVAAGRARRGHGLAHGVYTAGTPLAGRSRRSTRGRDNRPACWTASTTPPWRLTEPLSRPRRQPAGRCRARRIRRCHGSRGQQRRRGRLDQQPGALFQHDDRRWLAPGQHRHAGRGRYRASWWINFGAYTVDSPTAPAAEPRVVGFTGFGTLGGNNVSIAAGRDAGVRDARGGNAMSSTAWRRSQADPVVASTGRLLDGNLVLTGGGDLDLRIGGSLNPAERPSCRRSGRRTRAAPTAWT